MDKKIIFIALSVLIVLAGCRLDYYNVDKKDLAKDYAFGNQGIAMKFLEDSPREYLMEGEYLNIALELENKGTYEFPEGRIFASGYDRNAVSLRENILVLPQIEGKKASLPEGGSVLMKFDETVPAKVPYGDVYKPTLLVTSCYNYQTLATPSVCLITDTEELRKGAQICNPEIIHLSSQGAPVAVTKVEPRLGRDIMEFLITIENIGDGVIVKRQSFDRCPYELTHMDIDEVEVEVKIGSLGEPECTNGNKVKLYNKKGSILCKFYLRPDTKSFLTPLEITLDYGYSSSIKKTLEIRNPLYRRIEEKPKQSSTAPEEYRSVQPSKNCPCNTKYCVCLDVDENNFICDEPIQLGKGIHTLTVYGSSQEAKKCSIGANSGECPYSRNIEVTGPTSLKIGAYTAEGKALASWICNIKLKK